MQCVNGKPRLDESPKGKGQVFALDHAARRVYASRMSDEPAPEHTPETAPPKARKPRRKNARSGKQLAALMKAGGWSITRLATTLGVSRAIVCRWRRGDSCPYPRHVASLMFHFPSWVPPKQPRRTGRKPTSAPQAAA